MCFKFSQLVLRYSLQVFLWAMSLGQDGSISNLNTILTVKSRLRTESQLKMPGGLLCIGKG